MSDAVCLSVSCLGCRGICKIIQAIQNQSQAMQGPQLPQLQLGTEEVPFPIGKHPEPPKEGETSGVGPINLGSTSNVDDDVSEDEADLGTPGQFSEHNSTMHWKV